MMHYIDSDGVLHNLMKWFFEKDPDSLYSSDIRSRLLAQYSDEVFLGEQLPGGWRAEKPRLCSMALGRALDQLRFHFCEKPEVA